MDSSAHLEQRPSQPEQSAEGTPSRRSACLRCALARPDSDAAATTAPGEVAPLSSVAPSASTNRSPFDLPRAAVVQQLSFATYCFGYVGS